MKYGVYGVLAGRYRGRKAIDAKALLRHVVLEGAAKSLCGLRTDDTLSDLEEREPPTCPRCVARLNTRLVKEGAR